MRKDNPGKKCTLKKRFIPIGRLQKRAAFRDGVRSRKPEGSFILHRPRDFSVLEKKLKLTFIEGFFSPKRSTGFMR